MKAASPLSSAGIGSTPVNPPSPPHLQRSASGRKYVFTCLAGCAGLMVLVPVGLILFLLLFYTEENWRGAHAWEQAKANIKAQGETLDPTKFIPVPVPDAENFGALPYFKVVSVSGGIGGVQLRRFVISQTLKPFADNIAYSPKDSLSDGKLPFLGNWQKAQPPDPHNFAGRMVAFLKLHQLGVGIESDTSPFEIFARACPVMAKLRAAEQTHPQCLFQEPIDYREPWKQSFGTDASLLSLNKTLLYDAQLAMWSHHPDVALEDFRVGWKIASGVQKRPFYVSNLVATGMVAMQLRVIQQSLATHVWNDEQLKAMDGDLNKLDYLAQSRHQVNGEIACYSLPMIDFYAMHRGKWSKDVNLLALMFGDDNDWRGRAFQATYLLIPRGWFDLAKAYEAKRKVESLRRIDLTSHQIHPGTDPEKSADPAIRWLDFILPDPNLIGDIEKHIAYAQVQLDEARIACRLERYHLVHQKYPSTLNEIMSDYGPLPKDLINGQPYHYRLIAPQKYLLYSVGWNQMDDHGDAGNVRTWKSPDWIWTNYPDQK